MTVPRLSAVGVWLVPLAPRPSADTLACCHALLDAPERERACRCRHEPARDQFVVARATLRRLLSAYEATTAPNEWKFTVGAHGKPSVIGAPVTIEFNYAHAEGLVALAISRAGPVGIDVEAVDRPVDVRLFDRILSLTERAELDALSGDLQRCRFYAIWTAKEAYAKAIGTGLSESLAGTTIPSADATSVAIDGARPWQLHRIEAGERHTVALVTCGDAQPVAQWVAADDL